MLHIWNPYTVREFYAFKGKKVSKPVDFLTEQCLFNQVRQWMVFQFSACALEAQHCPSDLFCLYSGFFCDGTYECPLGEDEIGCDGKFTSCTTRNRSCGSERVLLWTRCALYR